MKPTTRETYGRTLAALIKVIGADTDVAPEIKPAMLPHDEQGG